jgi:hypothetical protein
MMYPLRKKQAVTVEKAHAPFKKRHASVPGESAQSD